MNAKASTLIHKHDLKREFKRGWAYEMFVGHPEEYADMKTRYLDDTLYDLPLAETPKPEDATQVQQQFNQKIQQVLALRDAQLKGKYDHALDVAENNTLNEYHGGAYHAHMRSLKEAGRQAHHEIRNRRLKLAARIFNL